MSEICKRVHDFLQDLPEFCWPFQVNSLPRNGIYFFYEAGETWGHGGNQQRIVRVGTHREGNFRTRVADHYIFNDKKMTFNQNQPAPKDRSIFRKNIGRALLHQSHDIYESIWKIDFTTRVSREMHGFRRNVEKEMKLEEQISHILRSQFTFRWIELEGEDRRIGSQGIEQKFIGTLAQCCKCRPSLQWLGQFSPKPKIAQSGLWLEQHLQAPAFINFPAEVTDLLIGH